MSDMSDVSPRQALILWCLLGRHGSAPQAEIVPAVAKADRDALVSSGHIAVAKLGRSLRLTVTDRGWHWAGGHLRDPLPPNHRALQDWLARLDAHLRATSATLAEFVGAPPEDPAPEKPARPPRRQSGAADRGATGRAGAQGATKAAGAGTRTRAASSRPAAKRKAPAAKPAAKPAARAAAARPPSPARLRARIEEAYLALTGGTRAEAVRLSALRAELGDLDRASVDAGLAAILAGDAKARLSQFTDPKSLDAAEREAAYSPAGEPFHILWIQ